MTKRSIILSTIILIAWIHPCNAERIILKNGKIIDAPIVKRDQKSIVVNNQGITLTYFLDDVSSIDGNDLQPQIIQKRPLAVERPVEPIPASLPKNTPRVPLGKMEEAQEFLQKGLISLEAKDYTKAIELFQKAVISNPNFDIAYCNLAECYYAINDVDKTILYAKKAIELSPQFSRAYLVLGFTYARSMQTLRLAEQALKKTISLDAKNKDAYKELGIIYQYLQEPDNAVAAYEKAIKLDNDNPDIAYLLGTGYRSQDNTKKALELFKRASVGFEKRIKDDPKKVDNYIFAAEAHRDAGEMEQALDNYKKAIVIKSDIPRVHYDIGRIYYVMARYKEAVQEFDKETSINPLSVYAYFALADTYSQLNDNQEAIRYYKKIIDIDPENADAYANIGYIYGFINQVKEARENFEKSIELFKKRGDLQTVKKIEEYVQTKLSAP